MVPAMQLLAEEVQEGEIVRTLLNVSLQMRLLDEQIWQFPEKERKWFDFTVGSLWEPAESGSPLPLSVREACNKIVHAKDIGFFVNDSAYDTDKFLVPRFLEARVSVYGARRSNCEWRAEIGINDFVTAGYWMARYA